LQQYVSQLQGDPHKHDLRERIIKLALEIKPTPAIPEEARKHFVIGSTLAKDAKNPTDCQSAVDELHQALLLAPWWGEAYWNVSGALLCAQKYEDARQAVRLYLQTNPGPSDARAAQDRLYVLDAKEKEKEKEAESESRASPLPRTTETAPQPPPKKELEAKELIESLDGAIYRIEKEYPGEWGPFREVVALRIVGRNAFWDRTVDCPGSPSQRRRGGRPETISAGPWPITGTRFYGTGPLPTVYTITADAITLEQTAPNGEVYSTVYPRVR
jgi:hypothetical protein